MADPIVIELTGKRARRLAALAHQKAGAEATAKAAVAHAQAIAAAWDTEVARALEDQDVAIPEGATVNHDLDTDRITVTPRR